MGQQAAFKEELVESRGCHKCGQLGANKCFFCKRAVCTEDTSNIYRNRPMCKTQDENCIEAERQVRESTRKNIEPIPAPEHFEPIAAGRDSCGIHGSEAMVHDRVSNHKYCTLCANIKGAEKLTAYRR